MALPCSTSWELLFMPKCLYVSHLEGQVWYLIFPSFTGWRHMDEVNSCKDELVSFGFYLINFILKILFLAFQFMCQVYCSCLPVIRRPLAQFKGKRWDQVFLFFVYKEFKILLLHVILFCFMLRMFLSHLLGVFHLFICLFIYNRNKYWKIFKWFCISLELMMYFCLY